MNLCDANQDFEYREKYEALQQEFEDFRKHTMTRLSNLAKSQGAIQQRNSHAEDLKEKDNNKVQLHLIKTHSKNLEERISVLNEELTKKEKELKAVVESQRQVKELLIVHFCALFLTIVPHRYFKRSKQSMRDRLCRRIMNSVAR